MRNFLLIATLMLSITFVYAQKKNVNNALKKIDSKKLAEAYDLLQAAKENPESKDLPKTWFALGRLYEEADIIQDSSILSKTQYALKEADKNYIKARELDLKKDMKDDINLRYYKMYNFSLTKGNETSKNKKYDKSFFYFSFALKINDDSNIVHKQPDSTISVISYYAALFAYQTGQWVESEKYFERSLALHYNSQYIYTHLTDCYLHTKDTLKAETYIVKGISLYPDSSVVLNNIIKFYILTAKDDRAIKYIDNAIKKDPNNPKFDYLKATLLDNIAQKQVDNIGMKEEAEKLYLVALKLDSNYFEANYNLGVLRYSIAIKYNNEAAKTNMNEQVKYDKLIDQRNEMYQMAIVPLEKAHHLQPKDLQTLNALKILYNRTKNKAKLDEVSKEIDNLSNKTK